MAASRIPLVVVLGATGAGKSKLAIEIAKVFNGEVISADSMQIYKGLDIISNKVTEEEQRECPHHMISYLDASSRHNTVVDFRDKALPVIEDIFLRGRMPIVVGGTNYYIESLLWDFLVKPQQGTTKTLPPGSLTSSNYVSGVTIGAQIELEPSLSKPNDDILLPAPNVHSGENKKRKLEDSDVCDNDSGNVLCDNNENGSGIISPSTKPINVTFAHDTKSFSVTGKKDFVNSSPTLLYSSAGPNNQSASLNQNLLQNSSQSRIASQSAVENNQPASSVTSQSDQSSQCSSGDDIGNSQESQTLLRLSTLTTPDLYTKLMEVDPDTAQRHHPNHRRKLLRALQVFYESGTTLSSILAHQHGGQPGANLKSGPLRFHDPCILWVKCQQPNLNLRLDGRVDSMIEQGLLEELETFDLQARQLQTAPKDGDSQSVQEFPHGIMQMIGFKEFKDFLQLSPEDRASQHGQKLFHTGVNDLKTVTRRYARQQVRWINNRFCSRPGPDVPPVYGVDSTDLTQWPATLQKALDVVVAFTKGETPKQEPEPTINRDNFQFERHVCDICGGRVFLHKHEWQGHVKSKKHRHNVKLSKKREELSSILGQREAQLAGQQDVDTDTKDDSVTDDDDDDCDNDLNTIDNNTMR